MKKQEIYEVDMDDDNPLVINYPDIGVTDALGPCIGVALLNKISRRGYLDHVETGNYRKVIDLALSEAGKPGELELVLAGNVPLLEEDIIRIDTVENFRNDEKRIRKNLMDYINICGIPKNNVRTYFPNNPSLISYKMIVDTKKSKIDVEREEDFD